MPTLQCQKCREILTMHEYSPGHVGLEVYRCDRCANSVARNKGNIPASYNAKNGDLASCMAPCECGGRYGRQNVQRCPHCLGELDLRTLLPHETRITKRDSLEFYPATCNRPLVWDGTDS